MNHIIGIEKTSLQNCIACLLFFICGVSACGNSDDTGNQVNGENPLQEINFSIIHEGSDGFSSGQEKAFVTLSTQQDYEATLSEVSSDSPSTVDFSSQRVLFVSMGEQSSGGFSIEVTRIEEFSDGLVATVVLSSPGDGCVVTQALTNPYKFIQLNSQDDDIQVSEQNSVVDCT